MGCVAHGVNVPGGRVQLYCAWWELTYIDAMGRTNREHRPSLPGVLVESIALECDDGALHRLCHLVDATSNENVRVEKLVTDRHDRWYRADRQANPTEVSAPEQTATLAAVGNEHIRWTENMSWWGRPRRSRPVSQMS